jgi:hypothetical protein
VISEQTRCDSSAIQLVSMHFVDAIYRRCDPLPYELLMLNVLTVESDAFWWLLRRLDLPHFPSLKITDMTHVPTVQKTALNGLIQQQKARCKKFSEKWCLLHRGFLTTASHKALRPVAFCTASRKLT